MPDDSGAGATLLHPLRALRFPAPTTATQLMPRATSPVLAGTCAFARLPDLPLSRSPLEIASNRLSDGGQ
jgi:hypothetical protein